MLFLIRLIIACCAACILVCNERSALSSGKAAAESPSGISHSHPPLLKPQAHEATHPAYILASYGEPKKAYDILSRSNSGARRAAHGSFFEARLLTESGYYERADSALTRACEDDSTRWGLLTFIWKARLNLLSGHPDIALENLRRIEEEPSPVLDPYIQSLLFEALTGCGQKQAAVELGEAVLDADGVDVLPLSIWEELINMYISDDSLNKAVRLAGDLAERRMTSEEVARITSKEIDLLYQLQRTPEAKAKTIAMAKERRYEDSTLRAVRWLLAKFPHADLNVDEHLMLAELLMRHGELQDARKLLVELGKRRLESSEVENRKILLADLYYKERKYSQAAELARQPYSSAANKRHSMLILARCYRRMGRPEASARLYEEFAAAFPGDAKAGEALFVAAELYSRVQDRKRTHRTLERLADTYPSGYFGHVAMLKLSWRYQQEGRDEKSAEILQRTLKRTRRYSEPSLYYLAEAYGRMGRVEEREKALHQLAELDSLSFYLNHSVEMSLPQQLMSSRGVIELQGENGLIEFLFGVTSQKRNAFEKILAVLPPAGKSDDYRLGLNHMETARIFLEMGFRDWGTKELFAAETYLRPSKRLIFELAMMYDHYGLTWKSMRWYQYVWDSIHGEERRSLSHAFSLLLHPLPFPAQVFENCARQGLPPHLVYAMIRAESGFNKTAVSRAGAVGLMQLMPGTGRDVARRLDLPDDFGEDLFAPEINLAFGIWYAAFLYGQCGDNPFMMLAAYNAGLTNAKRWFRHQNDQTVPRIVDGITYKETRNYVKKIVEYSHMYRNLYFDAGASHISSPQHGQ
jgi:soluble lytic murein transglycosylase